MRSFVTFMGALAAALLIAAPGLAQDAQSSPQVLNQVYACRDVAGDAERLACYDAAVGALRTAVQTGEVVAVDRQQAESVQRESFGFQIPSLAGLIPGFGAEEEPATELVVERVTPLRDGRHIFTMTNGQVWRQVSAERAMNVRTGTAVTIRRAALGSFMLISSAGGRPHRVRREE